jgi:hypothetical protein
MVGTDNPSTQKMRKMVSSRPAWVTKQDPALKKKRKEGKKFKEKEKMDIFRGFC